MNLVLKAFSPAEGIGIVQAEANLRLLRPPYSLESSPVIREDALREAVVKEGFASSNAEFESWDDVIDYLNSQVVSIRKSLGQEIPEFFDPREIVTLAPAAVLNKFLDRIEKDLIPKRLFDTSENFLIALLGSDAVINNPGLSKRAANLLQASKQKQEQAEAVTTAVAAQDGRFASLDRHHQCENTARLAKIIRDRRSVFALPG